MILRQDLKLAPNLLFINDFSKNFSKGYQSPRRGAQKYKFLLEDTPLQLLTDLLLGKMAIYMWRILQKSKINGGNASSPFPIERLCSPTLVLSAQILEFSFSFLELKQIRFSIKCQNSLLLVYQVMITINEVILGGCRGSRILRQKNILNVFE